MHPLWDRTKFIHKYKHPSWFTMCTEGQYKSRPDKANQTTYSAQTLSFYAPDKTKQQKK